MGTPRVWLAAGPQGTTYDGTREDLLETDECVAGTPIQTESRSENLSAAALEPQVPSRPSPIVLSLHLWIPKGARQTEYSSLAATGRSIVMYKYSRTKKQEEVVPRVILVCFAGSVRRPIGPLITEGEVRLIRAWSHTPNCAAVWSPITFDMAT